MLRIDTLNVTSVLLAVFIGSTAATAGEPTRVPIQILGNSPVIVAKIDGIAVPLIFDLGDESALALSKRMMDRLGVLPAGQTYRAKDAAGNVIRSGTFRLPELRIGNAVFTNVIGRPDFHDPSYQSSEVGQQGFLGTALLKSYKVVLDYQHQQMALLPKDSETDRSAKCMGTVVPFLPAWKGTAVTLVITDFGELTAVWDTSPVSILHKAQAQKITERVLTESVTTSRFILGGTNFGPLALDVADYTEPAGAGAIIGYNFFAHHIVCVDFPGKRLLIQN